MADELPLVADHGLPASPAANASSTWWALGWIVPLVLQVAHTVAVAPTYHVGSFDDDGNYLMAAHVLASGGWLTSVMPSGATVAANYLPGYPLLLVPVVWLFGSALGALRVLSGLFVGALYPLLWAWMRRRGLEPWARTTVLALLAINIVLATYSTMVMAEAPFLVVLVLSLFALDRWAAHPGWPSAMMVVVLLAELVWLKQAGIGLAVGLVGFELWHRRWARALGVGAGLGVFFVAGLGRQVGYRWLGRWATATPARSPTRAAAAWSISSSTKHRGTLVPYLSTYLAPVGPARG